MLSQDLNSMYVYYVHIVVFMGSDKYPGDNALDILTNRYGGYDNAFTDYERVSIIVSYGGIRTYVHLSGITSNFLDCVHRVYSQ